LTLLKYELGAFRNVSLQWLSHPVLNTYFYPIINI
jgi:hypothetical protein